MRKLILTVFIILGLVCSTNAIESRNDGGSGSGLDADTVDGVDSTGFVAVGGDTMIGDLFLQADLRDVVSGVFDNITTTETVTTQHLIVTSTYTLVGDGTANKISLSTTTISARAVGITEAPLIVKNLNAYASPFSQYIQLWLNESDVPQMILRQDGAFYISKFYGLEGGTQDIDTLINMGLTDRIYLQAGGLKFLYVTEATEDKIELGDDDWDYMYTGYGAYIDTRTWSDGNIAWSGTHDFTKGAKFTTATITGTSYIETLTVGDLTVTGNVDISSVPRAYFAYFLEGSSVYVNTAGVFAVLMGTGTLVEDNKESAWFKTAADVHGNNNRVTYVGPNTHQMLIITDGSFIDTEGGAAALHFRVTKNGTAIPLAEADGTSANVGSDDIDVSIVCHTEMATDDYIELEYKTDGDDPAVDHVHLSITPIDD